jgi:hypothetical protein
MHEQSLLLVGRWIDDRVRGCRLVGQRGCGSISVGKPDEIGNVRGLE